ncbi:MAG TPA: glycosyltransferase [Thermoanaerobaculia bacterium]|nr:glycosyltransferase [Thermoanaerobaculia bacterium]
MHVSIVVPAYNEPALANDIARIARVLPPSSEIVVVDDSDVTPEWGTGTLACPDRQECLSSTRVLRGEKRGKGDAVRLGMLAAEGEVVFHLDADIDDEKLALIPDFIRLIDEGHDVAIAERRSRWQYRNLGRFILSIGLFVAQRFFIFHSTRFFDTQCGFKAFRKGAARTLAELQTVRGGMYDIEYLYIAVKRGMRIAQVPIAPMRELRPSRLRVWRCLVTDPVDLVRVKWNGVLGRYAR